MQKQKWFSILILFVLANFAINAQPVTSNKVNDSLTNVIPDISALLQNVEEQRITDSIQKEELKAQLNNLKSTDKSRIEELQTKLKEIEDKENRIIEEKKQQIES